MGVNGKPAWLIDSSSPHILCSSCETTSARRAAQTGIVHDKVHGLVRIGVVHDKVHAAEEAEAPNYFVNFVVNCSETDYAVNFVVNYFELPVYSFMTTYTTC